MSTQYTCSKCGYGQDFEPLAAAMEFHFPELKEKCGAYECPSHKRGEFIPCKGKMIIKENK